MDANRWKSVAIRREIVEMAKQIGEATERPTSNVFAFAIKKLKEDLENGYRNEHLYDQNKKDDAKV